MDLDEGIRFVIYDSVFVLTYSGVDPSYRSNAILMTGTPISHLPTASLFAYATHFDAQPMGLEWVDDTTCVFVFPTKFLARSAYATLEKPSDIQIEEKYVIARPIPVALWPPEDRINKSLGKGEGLKGTIKMRWATHDDVKKKGAKKSSEFYRKHGAGAGKEVYNEAEPALDIGRRDGRNRSKRRRKGDEIDDDDDRDWQRAQLDDDLDKFLAEDDPDHADEEEIQQPDILPLEPEEEPVSKMRSDYIAPDGRTLLQRTSVIRVHPLNNGDANVDLLLEKPSLESRLLAPMPRSRGSRNGRMHSDFELEETRVTVPVWPKAKTDGRLEWARDRELESEVPTTKRRKTRRARETEDQEIPRNDPVSTGERRSRNTRGTGTREKGGGRNSRGGDRSRKSQQELDDELDAFLNQKD